MRLPPDYREIMKRRTMKPAFIAALLFTAMPSAHAQITPYISPGVQIGYGFGQGWFYSAQVSAGFFFFNKTYLFPAPAATLGFRKYKQQSMRYADVQISMFIGGVGIGRVKVTPSGNPVGRTEAIKRGLAGRRPKSFGNGNRFKIYFLLPQFLLAMGSYDSYKLAGGKTVRNMGLFLFLPIFDYGTIPADIL